MSPVGMPTVLGRHQFKSPANEYTVGNPSLSKKSLVAMPTVLGRLRFESPQSLRLAGKPTIIKLVMYQRPGFCAH